MEVPEGKVFDGWYMQSFAEDGQEHLKKMFAPGANGSVNLSGNKEPLNSMILIPQFTDVKGEG